MWVQLAGSTTCFLFPQKNIYNWSFDKVSSIVIVEDGQVLLAIYCNSAMKFGSNDAHFLPSQCVNVIIGECSISPFCVPSNFFKWVLTFLRYCTWELELTSNCGWLSWKKLKASKKIRWENMMLESTFSVFAVQVARSIFWEVSHKHLLFYLLFFAVE